MPMPADIGVIDTMLDLPRPGSDWTKTWAGLLRDRESLTRAFEHPAGYMYKDPVDIDAIPDPISGTLAEMDRFGIDKALISFGDDLSRTAIEAHSTRFLGQMMVDPNRGVAALRELQAAHDAGSIVAASFFPCGANVPIDDRRAYPLYAKCAELGIPIFVNVGVPGPRMPYKPQHVGLLDEVCWFFPELTIVMRHGGEPWTGLAVKLLLKWPNLYYSTSAFAPKYFPKDIIDFANRRGSRKVLYAGYYPSGLSLERSFAELPAVPLRDEVWPRFLRHNAAAVLGIGGADA